MNRACLLLGAAWLVALSTGCSGEPAATVAPDPFSTVAQQADEAYAQGIALYEEGRTREALDAFKRARVLSPSGDTRIEEMVQRLSAQLTPSPTPPPATPTPQPEPTPVVPTTATPSPEFGEAYFGRTFIAVVPGKSGVAVPMTKFFVQDHIGLYIEKLDERLHFAFKLRVFGGPPKEREGEGGPALVSDALSESLQRFQDKFVWYHDGVEPPGVYRVELYAGDTLTSVFEYEVGTEPVAIPTPIPSVAQAPTLSPEFSVTPFVPAAAQPQTQQQPAAGAAPAARQAPPPPVATPAPPAPPVATAQPMPVRATTLAVSAVPSALTVDSGESNQHLWVADRSGLVWDLGHGEPALRRPFSVSGEPSGLAVDSATARIYVAVRGQTPGLVVLDANTGQELASEPLPGDPGDVQLDASLGWLYVVLANRDAIASIDVRDPKVVRLTPGLPQVTGMAVDRMNHLVYATQLGGDLSIVDGDSGTISATLRLSDVGLSGVSTTADRVYAINTPGRELIALDASAMTVSRRVLKSEPAAIVAGPNSGAVFILNSGSNSLTRFDADGFEQGDTLIGDGGDGNQPTSLEPDKLWSRPRMGINSIDETVYVIEPDPGRLALAAPGT